MNFGKRLKALKINAIKTKEHLNCNLHFSPFYIIPEQISLFVFDFLNRSVNKSLYLDNLQSIETQSNRKAKIAWLESKCKHTSFRNSCVSDIYNVNKDTARQKPIQSAFIFPSTVHSAFDIVNVLSEVALFLYLIRFLPGFLGNPEQFKDLMVMPDNNITSR